MGHLAAEASCSQFDVPGLNFKYVVRLKTTLSANNEQLTMNKSPVVHIVLHFSATVRTMSIFTHLQREHEVKALQQTHVDKSVCLAGREAQVARCMWTSH